ncbi:MAG: hypothetical protein KBD78_09075 [Oligoflexales bacterium]|nr:hypothetical protein [Oligoflexales bacterium]
MRDESEFLNSASSVEIEMDSEWIPEVGQSSVDIALAAFSINVPSNVSDPKLNRDISDRGITFKRSIDELFQVEIGPAAFSSWSLLGSTLAHEVEVHCNQDFLAIYFLDVLGFEGTALAERSAYAYELAHAEYFRLSAMEKLAIIETKEDYYPLIKNKYHDEINKSEIGLSANFLMSKFTAKLQQFFARSDNISRVSEQRNTRTL